MENLELQPTQPAPVKEGISASPAVLPPAVPYPTSRAETIFALYCLVLGYIFLRWGLFFTAWPTTLFCWMFAAGVLGYAKAKGVQPAASSWYWLAIYLSAGTTYVFWQPGSLYFAQAMLIFFCAVYWVASLFGGLIQNKTSNFMPLDFINILLIVPFSNYGFLPRALYRPLKNPRNAEHPAKTKKTIGAVLVGLFLAMVFLAIVMPLLFSADNGAFYSLIDTLFGCFAFFDFSGIIIASFYIVGSLPISLYIFGLLGGFANKHKTKSLQSEAILKDVSSLRIIPFLSSVILIVLTSFVYGVFILSQATYFFSAFAGKIPGNMQGYSFYARTGFFELCRIASLNLGLLVCVNCLSSIRARESRLLRSLNLILCTLTLLIIATAASKMGLYIYAQGLTPKRVLTSVFMLFLAAVYIAICVLQYRQFSIIRFAAVLGAGMLCVLCLIHLDAAIAHYNSSMGYSLVSANTQSSVTSPMPA